MNMKFAFLIPYYNHPDTIASLCNYLKRYNIDIIIVDDGSDQNAKNALKNLNAQILTRTQNGGKGAAIKSGLTLANEQNYTHIFQIDADMQHELGKIDEILNLSKSNPN